MGAPGCIPEHLEETNFSTSPFLPQSLGVLPVRKTSPCPLNSRCGVVLAAGRKGSWFSADVCHLTHLDRFCLKSHHLWELPYITQRQASLFNATLLLVSLIPVFLSKTFTSYESKESFLNFPNGCNFSLNPNFPSGPCSTEVPWLEAMRTHSA